MTADISQSPDQTSPLSDWLNYMQQIHVSAIDMGLSRVVPVAERLALLQSAKKDAYVFTVAGTNGKGSTTAIISEICQQAGYKTALYQSPHIIDFNERVRINGAPVGDEVLVQAFYQVEKARLACELTLSFFEMTTLAAMLIFAQADCDVWVLEVGLGGRLDVVNIIDPDLAVITNIGIDHVDWLGDTREKIGYEKAGILREGITLIYGSDDMPKTVVDKVNDLNVTCYQAGQDYAYYIEDNKSQWQFSSAAITMQLPIPALSIHNSANAVAAVIASSLHITQSHIEKGLKKVKLAGRFDVREISNAHGINTQWVFDVAHNAEGINFLLPQFTTLWQQYRGKQDAIATKLPTIHIVFSMLADKAILDVATLLLQGLSALTLEPNIQWHISMIDHPRADTIANLAQAINSAQSSVNVIENEHTEAQIFTYDTLEQAGEQVLKLCEPDDIVLVCGSFHTIAAVMHTLGIKL